MEKLKPCPWCGEIPIVNCYYNNYWIDCTCGVIKHTKCANSEDAIKDWNTYKNNVSIYQEEKE